MSTSSDRFADWCETQGNLTICGTRTVEYARDAMGVKWCFHCRTRHEFWWVYYRPDGLSYYGPHAQVEGIERHCTDLFPGWTRGWGS